MADKAPVAIGSLYIDQYFTEADKSAAEQMVEVILGEYKELILKSEWMDNTTRMNALNTTNNMLRFIGYHENLRHAEANFYYNDLERWTTEGQNFFELTLSFVVLNTDREFNRLHLKRSEKKADWTK